MRAAAGAIAALAFFLFALAAWQFYVGWQQHNSTAQVVCVNDGPNHWTCQPTK
jgi:hypothetical protein